MSHRPETCHVTSGHSRSSHSETILYHSHLHSLFPERARMIYPFSISSPRHLSKVKQSLCHAPLKRAPSAYLTSREWLVVMHCQLEMNRGTVEEYRSGRNGPDSKSGCLVMNWARGFESHLLRIPRQSKVERCPSGLRSTLGKRVYGELYRGFESRPLRHSFENLNKSCSSAT